MAKYRKLPVVIDAIEWTGENLMDVLRFTGVHFSAKLWSEDDFKRIVRNEGLKIFTLEGSLKSSIGDYIIRGVSGEFYPCKPDIFHKTYEPAE